MKIADLMAIIIIFIVGFKIIQMVKNKIFKEKIKKYMIILVVVFCIYIVLKKYILPIEVIQTFLNIELDTSEVISMCALIFTLFSYTEKSVKEQKDNLKKQDMDTFFKLLELLSKKAQEIEEREFKNFINSIKEKLSKERVFEVHKAYFLSKVLKKQESKIKILLKSNENNDNIEKGELLNIEKKLNELIESDNFETMFKLINSPNFKNFVGVETTERRKGFFSFKEMSILESIGILSVISEEYSDELIQKSPITYRHAYNIINRTFDSNKNGDFFRVLHRAVKIIKTSEIENKSKFYGIIRAVLPDYLLVYVYYNSVFTEKGLGLGLQLNETSFFGEADDFFFKDNRKDNGILDFTQHIPKNYLIFKRQDPQLMIRIFSKKNKYKDIQELQEAYELIFDSRDIQFKKSFNTKEIN